MGWMGSWFEHPPLIGGVMMKLSRTVGTSVHSKNLTSSQEKPEFGVTSVTATVALALGSSAMGCVASVSDGLYDEWRAAEAIPPKFHEGDAKRAVAALIAEFSKKVGDDSASLLLLSVFIFGCITAA
jgi:hypothetical protein